MKEVMAMVQTQTSNEQLQGSIENAVSVITKGYLGDLENYVVKKPSSEEVDIDIETCGRFFQIKRLVFNQDENFLDKLTTIVNVAFNTKESIVTILSSDGREVQLYIGIIAKREKAATELSEQRRKANATAFEQAIAGNLAGSRLEKVDVATLQRDIFAAEKVGAISAVSEIVSLRNKGANQAADYVQGIENLTDSLRGECYSIILVADPVTGSNLQEIKQGYEALYSQLSTFAASTLILQNTESTSLTESQTKSMSEGLSKGVSSTQSITNSTGKFSAMSVSAGINLGVTLGGAVSLGKNSGTASGRAESQSISETLQLGTGESRGSTVSSSEGMSLQIQTENKTVKNLLGKIDQQLERLDGCESFGAFNCAAYVLAANQELSVRVAGNYSALMRGEDTSVQAAFINSWDKRYLSASRDKREEMHYLQQYLKCYMHPKFYSGEQKSFGDKLFVTPASIIHGKEIAVQLGLPKKSIPGLSVVHMTPFGRNMSKVSGSAQLRLGELYHMGKPDEQAVAVDVQSLAAHTFITGSTGAGKSNAIYTLLTELRRQKVNFLVIEPAKGEYKQIFGGLADVSVYGTNEKKAPLLRIDPFSFPEDIHVLEHIDRLIEIFNVCWPMYAAMPAVLKEAVERAYRIAGWDMVGSVCRHQDCFGAPLYPTFADVENAIVEVVQSSYYSADNKGDYMGALCTRVHSLTNGIYGQIFTADELSFAELFDRNVIVDLSRCSSMETKALLMGILVMKLQEYRMSANEGGNIPLQHVTVLEEAHHLLKRTGFEQGMETANLVGKSVEMLANAIAEMRTYGEGFIIADQSPGLMDMSVIRNTNTKLILRLPDYSDRELVGRAAALNDEQIGELARLETGVAAIYQNNWNEAVLCKIDQAELGGQGFVYKASKRVDENHLTQSILKCLLCDIAGEKVAYFSDDLAERIYRANYSTEVKINLAALLASKKPKTQEEVYGVLKLMFPLEKLSKMHNQIDSPHAFNLSCTLLGLDQFSLSERYETAFMQVVLESSRRKFLGEGVERTWN